MNDSPTIRLARLKEIGELSALAMRSKAYWGYSESFLKKCRDELTISPRTFNSSDFHYQVAEKDSALLGYYAIKKLAEYEFELEALFVDPSFIGTGVGRLLMNHAKNLTRNMGGKALIIQSDPNAVGFYLASGAKPNGVRESASISGRTLPLLTVDLAMEHRDMIEVRTISASDDLEKLVSEINSASWDGANDMTPYDADALSAYLQRQDTLFVTCHEARSNNQILLGFASARIEMKPYDRERWLYVDEVDVCVNQRRRGAGKALMKRLLEIAGEKGCSEVWLGTEPENKAANALYQSLKPDDIAKVVGYAYEINKQQ
ncbi:MAG: GNAT family N-acetyltransferase [Thiolinea sp.]